MKEIFLEIIGSEFLWGTLLGLALTYIGGALTLRSQKLNQEKVVKSFCEDTITNVLEYVSHLDQFRDRSRTIHPDFIELIEIEIQAYGRNRDHLISVSDRRLRKRVRDFFTDTAVQLANIKKHLDNFYRLNNLADAEADQVKKEQLKQQANNALSEAHKACDRIVSVANKNEDLKTILFK